MATLITFGDNTKLKLKIPSKGDTNWAEDFKTYFVDPIVEHDHSGANGKGKQLTEASLADNALVARHVNFNLDAINNVSPTAPSTNQYLKYTGTQWAPAAIDDTVVELNNGDVSGSGGIGTDASGVGLGANAEVHISNIQNTDLMDFSSRNASTTPANTMVGIKFVIDSATTANKTVKFNNLRDCIIISNVDIEVAGTIDKCIIIMENNDTTVGDELCTLKLTSATESTPIVNASKILTDVIEVSAGTTVAKKLFSDSEIKTKDLKTELAVHAGAIDNSITITRSNVEIAEQFSNSIDLSSQAAVVLTLDNSKVSLASLNNITINNTIANVDANSELKQIASNYVKVWAGTRWNYLVSPSGINKVITADSSGVPVELSVSDGHVVKGSSSGLVSQDNVLNNINNVNTSGVATDQFLKYDGSNWVDSAFTLTGSKSINTGSSPSSGQVLTYNGSQFAPATPIEGLQIVEHTATVTLNLNKSSYSGGNPHNHQFTYSLNTILASHLSSNNIASSSIQQIELIGTSTYSHTGGFSNLFITRAGTTGDLGVVVDIFPLTNYPYSSVSGLRASITASNTLASYSSSGSSTNSRSGNILSGSSSSETLWTPSMGGGALTDTVIRAEEYFMNDSGAGATYVLKFKISAYVGPTTTSAGSLTKNTGN